MALETTTKLKVTHAPGVVTIEPEPIHGVPGFTITMSPARTREFARELMGAAVQAMPPTCRGGA